MVARLVQNDFSHGELDPRMYSRPDIIQYNKGAKYLRNVIAMPHGGVKRRFGTGGIYHFPGFIDDSTKNSRLFILKLSGQSPLLINIYSDTTLTPKCIVRLFKDDVYIGVPQQLGGFTGFDYSYSELDEVVVSQSSNNMVFTHPNYPPIVLWYRNNGTSSAWTLSLLEYINRPTADYTKNYDACTVNIYATGGGAFAPTDNTTGYVCQVEVLTVTPTDYFTDDKYVGGLLYTGNAILRFTTSLAGAHGGKKYYAKIVQRFSTNLDDSKLVDKTVGISGEDVLILQPLFDSTYSTTYPISSVFFQGRYIFGGGAAARSICFFSALNSYFDAYNTILVPKVDFNDATVDDDTSGFQGYADSPQLNAIKYLTTYKTLVAFTEGNVFSTNGLITEALGPSNIAFTTCDQSGISDVQPIVFDQQILYVRKGGKAIHSLTYEPNSGSYTSDNISLISAHLIRNPTASAIFTDHDLDVAEFAFFVNEDGTVACYQSIIGQNVSSWTLLETNGHIYDVVSHESDVYFLVQRNYLGMDALYLEKLDFDVYTDCTITQTFASPTTTITGLDVWFDIVEVDVIADGYYIGKKHVSTDPLILDKPATTVSVGYNFDVLIEPMPVEVQSENGTSLLRKKEISKIYVDYYQSLYLQVNNVDVPYTLQIDSPPEEEEGIYEMFVLNDWDERQSLTITQSAPGPMYIRAIGYDVQS